MYACAHVCVWQYDDECGATLRLHVGLEDVEDLIDDLANGFDAMRQASSGP